MRKIVQICATPDTDTQDDVLYALCDDGAVFAMVNPISESPRWYRIKQPPRDEPGVVAPSEDIEFEPTGEFPLRK